MLRDAMQAWPMPSCGVCLSVTFVTSVKTNKHIFSPSCSYTILVFSYQVSWQYSDGDPLNGASNAGGVGTNHDCWRYSWLSMDDVLDVSK